MKKQFLSLIILFAMLTACAPQLASTPVQPSLSATPTITSAPAVQAATATPQAVLPTRTPAPQPTAAPQLTEECIRIEKQIPADLSLSGVWVYNPGSPYLENLTDHMVYSVPLEGGGQLSSAAGDIAISPDGTHMAYIDQYLNPDHRYQTDKRILRVIRSSGHELDMSYWLEVDDWQWIIGWVDNQNLAIATGNKDIVILNPITGYRRKFDQPEWVNFNADTNNYRWDASNYPLYNPNLKWILEHPDYEHLDLKDVQTGKTLWQGERSGWSDWFWSANTTTFAVYSEPSILVFKDGKQTAKFVTSQFDYDYVSNLKLSPNGQKLAFNSSKDQYSHPTILDVEHNKITRLCADGYDTWWNASPIWSPDSRFMLEHVHDTSYNYFDVLIDTQQMRAYLLKSGYYRHRIAWLADPSPREIRQQPVYFKTSIMY